MRRPQALGLSFVDPQMAVSRSSESTLLEIFFIVAGQPRNMYHLWCTEMEVTEIILAKIYRLCQLLSDSRRGFARVFNP